MDLTKKNKIISRNDEEDIETVEGELIEVSENTGIEEKKKAEIKVYGPMEFAAGIGAAAIGLFKLFRFFSGGNSGNKPFKMRKRRRRR